MGIRWEDCAEDECGRQEAWVRRVVAQKVSYAIYSYFGKVLTRSVCKIKIRNAEIPEGPTYEYVLLSNELYGVRNVSEISSVIKTMHEVSREKDGRGHREGNSRPCHNQRPLLPIVSSRVLLEYDSYIFRRHKGFAVFRMFKPSRLLIQARPTDLWTE